MEYDGFCPSTHRYPTIADCEGTIARAQTETEGALRWQPPDVGAARYSHHGRLHRAAPGPGGFYPYWSMVKGGHSCVLLFGNVSAGSTFGKDAQYGTNQFNTYGYPQFISKSHNNPCR